jgi:hypothetical protein
MKAGGGGDGVSQPETSEKKGTYEISPHGAHVPGYLLVMLLGLWIFIYFLNPWLF